MFGLLFALLGFVLLFITKQGHSLNPFNRPKQHSLMRLVAFVGFILIVLGALGVIEFLNSDAPAIGKDIIGYIIIITILGAGVYLIQLRIRGKTRYRIFDPYVLKVALVILVGILSYVFGKALFGG